MRKGSEDAGGLPEKGGPSEVPPQSSQELQEMKDQFEHQQMLITQLKEIIKKTDQTATTVTQEKVAEYANTLTKMKSRAKRHSLVKEKDSDAEVAKLSTPASEKVLLLRQQLEQNKAKLAERGKSQKGIEEMVAQVKAQLDDSQQQIHLTQTPLNISLFDDRVDYTPQLGSLELYNILLNKDKRINEMNAKILKLQANVMDLQENVKEKDSVIDARTKAITLMSENLSKKGKNTVDALEDTKEQMRRMQENFIEIEEQLKAENATLKTGLADKSVEIQRLQAENDDLVVKNSELQKTEATLQAQIVELGKTKTSPTASPSRRSPSKNRKSKRGKFPSKADEENIAVIADLEKQLSEKAKEIEVRKRQHQVQLEEHEKTIKEMQEQRDELQLLTEKLSLQREAKVETIVHEAEFDNAELNKMKQQLDEANKSMIKVKAQHKSKLKELTKKIEDFKKISDVNAELVKMENENSKLQLKIAVLEEEKGQMQLGMVDSRVSTNVEELNVTIKDLTTKLEDQEITVNNHLTENAKYREEVQNLRAKLEQMTSDEVKQELTTVQFEEQYESLEKEKASLQAIIDSLEQQIVEINRQLDASKKEKSEIQIKCEGLLQENAELIDRLEKLSTEKVSSAESIEIVENLTQQEKLELEAYQKSLLPKTGLENLDDNADLNDSVNQLTEETSELLQKIELFTVERREVMEKLELLTEENSQLSLKLKEVENNRDVLVETYEQLQTEKEVLDAKLEEYEAQITEYRKTGTADTVDHSEVEEYKKFVQVQKEEISDLQLKLLSFEKKDCLGSSEKEWEDKYMRLIAENEELVAQVAEIKQANQNYEEIIQENKHALIKYAELLDANCKLNEQYEQVKLNLEEHRHAEIERENRLEQSKLEIKDLAQSVNEYEKELNEKCDAIKNLESQIRTLHEEKVCIENNLAEKLNEVETVRLEKKQKEIENEKLMKQAQNTAITSQQSELELKIQELHTKNKEQLEKMKKIAANLKKKTLDYKELEAKYNELSTPKECVEIQEAAETAGKIIALEAELTSTLNELQSLKQDYAAKNEESLNLKEQQRFLQQENNQIKTRNEEITTQLHTYSAQIEDLQNIIREYESQLGSLNREVESMRSSGSSEEKDATIRRLNEEIDALKYNSQTSNNALQIKIHEQEVCIETQEQELQTYKEKASKLEEGLSEVEARRQSLELKTIDLGNKLESRESRFIEAAEKEEHLESRLKAIAEKDRRIEEKLVEVQEENGLLHSNNQRMAAEVEGYKKQVNSYNLRLREYEEIQEVANAMEAEKQELLMKCKSLENEIKKVNMDLSTLQTETDRSENELQQQLERYAGERKQLMEQLEILREEIVALVDSRNEFQRTVDDLNNKLDQQQTEFEDTINKYHDLQQEHKKTLSRIEEFDKVVGLQEERIKEYQNKEAESPEYLQHLLNQKLYELEEFNRNYVPSPADFFSENTTQANLNKEIEDLQHRVSQHQRGSKQGAKLQELEHELQQRVESLQMNETLLKQLQEELSLKDDKIKQGEAAILEGKTQLDFARNMLEQMEANNFETLNRNNELEQLIQSVEQERNGLEQQVNSLQLHQTQPQQRLQWPETSDDPFAFVQDPEVMTKTQVVPVQASNDVGNTQEELLQKIKTLEFMLYNAEQEKESAQIQCAQLSEELGRFIYAREQRQMASSLVMPGSEASNVTTSESQFNLESQIVSGDEVSIPPQIPYEPSKDPEQCSSSQNISEVACSLKRAYECTPSAFADDDGWGFDVEETKLEESHAQSSSAPVSGSVIGELEERIRLLNLERDAHLEEIHQANVKSGKLIKKLKEFKARNEQLVAKMKSKSNDGFGLEDAIQEELKMQIATLEKKLKESDAELIKERAERENIAKRAEVLAAANERMVEMKEKQDIEVLGYQQQARDLQLKLERVAWSSDFSEPVVSTSSNTSVSVTSLSTDSSEKQAQDLRESIRELTLDNEELQAMLEEQTRLRKEAESRAKSVPTDVVDHEQLRTALAEKANLISQIVMHESDKDRMREELERTKANFIQICDERDVVQVEVRRLSEKLQENYKEKTLLEASLLENGILIESLKKTIDEMQESMEKDDQMKTELHNLKTEKEAENKNVQEELELLQATMDSIRDERQALLDKNSLLESTIDDLRTELARQQSASNEERESLLQEIANLKEELKEVATLRSQLLDQQSEFEQKLLTTTENLALEWSQHVDQRGNDVAESWKLHVETRENEFVQLERSLRKELNEVEERCNALVNENNELRRNVDTEIRNEVDRISAMQQQIADRQALVSKLREENANLITQLHDYEGRINNSSEELTTLLQRQDEKDKTIGELSARLQCAADNKASEELIEALRAELAEKDNEITQCKCTIDDLTTDMEEMAKVKSQVAENQLQLSELSKEKERNDKLRLKLEESAFQVTTLQGTLQEKEHRLQELETHLQQLQSNDTNTKMQLQTHVQELQQQIAQYAMQLQENNLHIGSLNEEIESYKVLSNHLQSKDTEIQRLNNLLEERGREHEYALENQLLESQSVLSAKTQEHDALRRLLNQTEIARDEMILTKDAELDACREQLESVTKQLGEYQVEYATVQNKLVDVSGYITAHEQQIAMHQEQLAEYQRQIAELNGIIGGQVLKIEELQHDIYEKSRNYDALVAQMDDPKELQKKVRFSESTKAESASGTASREEDPFDAADRAELDLALYMLHQRDVRCEELTVELMQLLEERDTLQLRLSNALRENETIRANAGVSGDAQSGEAAGSTQEVPVPSNTDSAAQSSTTKDGHAEGGLANKLTELKVVGYKKDKTLVDEQDLRRLQQMALLQQHKDDVSRLPAEAQARLRDANYTLSRDVQSPSKVLLNWLWGTSTPKVMPE